MASDGCALDAEGALWIADCTGSRALRVLEGGQITDEIAPGQACSRALSAEQTGERCFFVLRLTSTGSCVLERLRAACCLYASQCPWPVGTSPEADRATEHNVRAARSLAGESETSAKLKNIGIMLVFDLDA